MHPSTAISSWLKVKDKNQPAVWHVLAVSGHGTVERPCKKLWNPRLTPAIATYSFLFLWESLSVAFLLRKTFLLHFEIRVEA